MNDPQDTAEQKPSKPKKTPSNAHANAAHTDTATITSPTAPTSASREVGGRKGPDPTRYGDWEKGGRCIDF